MILDQDLVRIVHINGNESTEDTILGSLLQEQIVSGLMTEAYTPTTGADWPGTDPISVQEALDMLASVRQLKAFTATTSGNWSPAPTTVQIALDQLAARVKVLEGP